MNMVQSAVLRHESHDSAYQLEMKIFSLHLF